MQHYSKKTATESQDFFSSHRVKSCEPQTEITIKDSGHVYWSNASNKRFIGRIQGQTYFCSRDPERHLHRKSRSYGFNYALVRDGYFKWIVVNLPEDGILQTTREYLLRRGFFLHFPGFEKQIFLHLEDFGLDKAEEFRPEDKQLDIFQTV